MTEELSERDLVGARFRRVDLSGASFDEVRLNGARFYEVDLSGVRMRGAYLRDVEINGDLESIRINGIDVAPLIEAQLDRRHPERRKLRPTDAAGARAGAGLAEARALRRARGPGHRHQRGVVAPAVRRARPRRSSQPPIVGPAMSARQ